MTDRAGVARHLKAADVFVQTSRWDACSLASIEAIALELPCILSTKNGVSTYRISRPCPTFTWSSRVSRQ